MAVPELLAPTSSGVSPKTVERAVNALLKWRASRNLTQKPQLLETDEFVYLILTLKKIPQKPDCRTNAYKIPVPHSLIRADDSLQQLCLIIDDRPKSKPKTALTKDAARKKIQNDGIPISKVIKLSKLRTDYRPFEAKRKLCDSYDMFLADKSLLPLLPRLLGKQFFKKKKIPVGIDLSHSNWKEQVEKVCGSALLYLTTGTCSVVKVGRVSMSKDEIAENVLAAIGGIVDVVPRKWGGIRSLHLKLLASLALPLYVAVPDLKMKIDGAKEDILKEDGGEKFEAAEVKEEDKKKKKIGEKRIKGRIHEVRYMDSNTDVNEGDAIGNSGGEGEGDVDDDDAEVDTELQLGKKRNRKHGEITKKKVGSQVKKEEGKGMKEKKHKGKGKDKNQDGVKKMKQKKDL